MVERSILMAARPGHRAYVASLECSLRGCASVLDVGCGTASPLAQVRGDFASVGLDAHRPALELSRRAGLHDDYIQQQLPEIDLEPGAFDAVVMLDLIEHLAEPDALELLRRADRIARRRVIVFTPNGFLEQGEYGDNPWQVHRSGWTPERLRELGFRVLGLNGLRVLRGERGRLRGHRTLAAAASLVSQPFVFRRPELAFALLGVKESGARATPPRGPGRLKPALTEPAETGDESRS